jgi:hypothetical protein
VCCVCCVWGVCLRTFFALVSECVYFSVQVDDCECTCVCFCVNCVYCMSIWVFRVSCPPCAFYAVVCVGVHCAHILDATVGCVPHTINAPPRCCVCAVVYALLCMRCCVCAVVYALLCMRCCVCAVVCGSLCACMRCAVQSHLAVYHERSGFVPGSSNYTALRESMASEAVSVPSPGSELGSMSTFSTAVGGGLGHGLGSGYGGDGGGGSVEDTLTDLRPPLGAPPALSWHAVRVCVVCVCVVDEWFEGVRCACVWALRGARLCAHYCVYSHYDRLRAFACASGGLAPPFIVGDQSLSVLSLPASVFNGGSGGGPRHLGSPSAASLSRIIAEGKVGSPDAAPEFGTGEVGDVGRQLNASFLCLRLCDSFC